MQYVPVFEDFTQKERVIVICAQKQGYNAYERNNGGLFALANAMMLLDGMDPCQFTLSKDMRGQLRKMLSNGQFTLFKCKSKKETVKQRDVKDWNSSSKTFLDEEGFMPPKKKARVVLKKLGASDKILNQFQNKVIYCCIIYLQHV